MTEPDPTEIQEMSIWLLNGIARGWISPPFCYTHNPDEWMSDEERDAWEDGGDPCSFVVKMLYE